ncbi:hypothetical protein PSV08DRAFT_253856 [Bipolaris maydis]|uniref:uncharacterized protein n=1 Tax=Cochliobolus heterostrophus TaxID=5016 RepID=UPI0024DB2C5B|nr:hypothetical protein J3E73DRAFT_348634 [Bipolaris maydis]KAJ5055065.1 hypothetical protein J3E74DRAFT_383395 [Bipolaris maydis]KAJ6275472.1 hypothetical protein PSV08DRAFT_253856 [Bipolaris maydis]
MVPRVANDDGLPWVGSHAKTKDVQKASGLNSDQWNLFEKQARKVANQLLKEKPHATWCSYSENEKKMAAQMMKETMKNATQKQISESIARWKIQRTIFVKVRQGKQKAKEKENDERNFEVGTAAIYNSTNHLDVQPTKVPTPSELQDPIQSMYFNSTMELTARL